MSVGPLLQSFGRQHFKTAVIPEKLATLSTVILVGPPAVLTSLHCKGDVVLLHGVSSEYIHPPSLTPSNALLCTQYSVLAGRRYDPLGNKLF